MGHSKRKLVFQPSIFRCYVSFKESIPYIEHLGYTVAYMDPIKEFIWLMNSCYSEWWAAYEKDRTYTGSSTLNQW